MAGWRGLIFMDSRILPRHILSSRPTLWLCPFWLDVHVLPQLFVETSVLGGLSSLPPVCAQFDWHTGQGILDTGFHRQHHTFYDQVSCLWGGPGWSAGCWRAFGKPPLHGFWKFWPVFQMYLWYKVVPHWCGPGPCDVTQGVELVSGWGIIKMDDSDSLWGQYVVMQDPWVHRDQDPPPGQPPRPGIWAPPIYDKLLSCDRCSGGHVTSED